MGSSSCREKSSSDIKTEEDGQVMIDLRSRNRQKFVTVLQKKYNLIDLKKNLEIVLDEINLWKHDFDDV